MNITLYKCSADPRRLNKGQMLSTIETINNAKVLYPTTVLRPTFTIEYTAARMAANYCYISDFERYYFLGDPQLGNGNILTFSGEVDVLNSFRTQINNLDVVCLRSSEDWNEYITDNLPSSVKANITNYRFGDFSFSYPTDKITMSYALVLNGLVGDP